MNPWAQLVVAALTVLVDAWAMIVLARRPGCRRRHRALNWTAAGLGCLLGLLGSMVHYRVSETVTFFSFPIPAAVFINGRDYVGPTTGPFTVINFLLWALLPQVAVAIVVRLREPRKPHQR